MIETIFDTDPGIDDAMALAFLARRPEFDLRGITTVLGNARIETVTRNALVLRQRFGLAAPVAKGAADTLRGRGDEEALHVHGANGLGDIVLPEGPFEGLDPRPAHHFIIDALRARPGAITLIAVGRLTNLALALRTAPEIVSLARGVVVMGGAFGFSGHTGNVRPHAEANISGDPEAADAVFTAGWPVTIVGLDVTEEVILDAGFLDRLGERGGADGAFLRDISRFYQRFHRERVGIDGIYGHDFLAVAVAMRPDLFETRRGTVRVVCEGAFDGRTVLTEGPGPCTVCIGVDARAILTLYAQTFGVAR